MKHLKYYAEIRFYQRRVRFTAVDLERLLVRFNAEVLAEQERSRAAREYTWIMPQLTVEVCSSWSQFISYEHA